MIICLFVPIIVLVGLFCGLFLVLFHRVFGIFGNVSQLFLSLFFVALFLVVLVFWFFFVDRTRIFLRYCS